MKTLQANKIFFICLFFTFITISTVFAAFESVNENGDMITIYKANGSGPLVFCAQDPALPPNTVEIAYDDGCWDDWGYNVQNEGVEGSFYQGLRVRFTTPANAKGVVKEVRVCNWLQKDGYDQIAKFVIYNQSNVIQGAVTASLAAEMEKFQIVDLSSIGFTPGPGNDFYIAFEPGGDICLPGTNCLVVGDDDSSNISGRSEVRSGDCTNEWWPVDDANHLLRAVVATKEGGSNDCLLNVEATYQNGTLSLDFTIGMSQPASWNVWLAYMNKVIPLLTGVKLPALDPPIQLPVPLANFPHLGKMAVLTTLTAPNSPEGIICSDLATVDTGTSVGSIDDSAEMENFTNILK